MKDRKFRRDELLDREKAIREPPSLVFSVSYHPAFFKTEKPSVPYSSNSFT